MFEKEGQQQRRQCHENRYDNETGSPVLEGQNLPFPSPQLQLNLFQNVELYWQFWEHSTALKAANNFRQAVVTTEFICNYLQQTPTQNLEKYEILASSLKHQKQLKDCDTKKDCLLMRHSSLSGPSLCHVTFCQISYYHFRIVSYHINNFS